MKRLFNGNVSTNQMMCQWEKSTNLDVEKIQVYNLFMLYFVESSTTKYLYFLKEKYKNKIYNI